MNERKKNDHIEREKVLKKIGYMYDESLGYFRCVLVEDIEKIPAAQVVPMNEYIKLKNKNKKLRNQLNRKDAEIEKLKALLSKDEKI